MLTAAFTPRMEEYARRVGRVGQMHLVVFAIDSLHLGVHTPSNHDCLKRTFSSKIYRLGNEHPAPHPRPGMVPPPHDLQLDLTAGSGSVGGTFSCPFLLHALASLFTFVPLFVPYFSSENIV